MRSVRKSDRVVSVAALAFAAHCGLGNAAIVTTAPEVESFNLTPAQTATFHVSNSQPPQGSAVIVNNNSGPRNASTLLNFNQFNTALGTLVSVAFTFQTSYALTPGLTVTFFSGPDADDPGFVNFFADGSLGLSLSGPAGTISTQSPGPLAASATCGSDHLACNSSNGPTSGSFNGSTSGLTLAPFMGSGNFDLTAALTSALMPRVSPDNGTNFADNATMDGTLSSNWAGSVSLVYTYDTGPAGAVPEPFTLYLVLAALAGVALLPRRRA